MAFNPSKIMRDSIVIFACKDTNSQKMSLVDVRKQLKFGFLPKIRIEFDPWWRAVFVMLEFIEVDDRKELWLGQSLSLSTASEMGRLGPRLRDSERLQSGHDSAIRPPAYSI